MADSLTGTVALVTGASSGIGQASAATLAAQGAAVALVARRTDRLEELASSIRANGGTALTITADVTDQQQAEQAVATAVEKLGRLDTVINNAGVMLLGPVVDAPLEEWERMVDLNIKGLLYVAHAALPHLLTAAEADPRRVADLVNVSSVAGRVARSGSGVYNATKHAVGAFSEALRQEVTAPTRARLARRARRRRHRARFRTTGPRSARGLRQRFGGLERMAAEDIAETVEFIVTRPRHVAVNEVLIRPTEQEG